ACTLDAPGAQGVCAFFDPKKEYSTSTLRVRCGNGHAALLAVALDGKPLAESERVLAQLGTECRPEGWKETPAKVKAGKDMIDGFKLESHGKAPWRVEKGDCKVAIRNRVLRRATACGPDGRAAGEVETRRDDKGLSFRFPPEALYVVLRK
ncbi:MAG: hypothetical protein K2W96_27250, partial [Gemmataceae bacterium]|nr:hypothetical protein [Gemmataceae bacterium]